MIDEYHILAQAIRYHIASINHPEMEETKEEHLSVAKYFHGRGNRDYDIIYEAVVRYLDNDI